MTFGNLVCKHIKWIVLLGLIFPLRMNSAEVWQIDYANQAKVIYNLNKFVEWNSHSTTGINICFLGNNTELLKKLAVFNGTKIAEYLVNIKQINNAANKLSNCQMLYIHEDKMAQLPAILQNLQHKSILTVSNIPDFAQQGGMIGIIWLQTRVKFEINLPLIKQANIYVSSTLLNLAKIVN